MNNNQYQYGSWALITGATGTPMAHTDGMDMDKVPMPWMEPNQVAKIGLRNLGGRRAVDIPGRLNRIMNLMMSRLIPRKVAVNLFGTMMGRAVDPSLI